MNKLISNGKEALDKIIKGVDLVANPVKSTLSPFGKTVILSESRVADYGLVSAPVRISKDGFNVSQSISSQDVEIQVGVKMMQEIAEKQVIDSGDASTTVCLLTQVLLQGGAKLINSGLGRVEVVRGINFAVSQVVNKLKELAIPLEGNVELVRQVATVCSNNDTFIGNLIAEAFDKTGNDGIINLQESRGYETSIKISEGIKFGIGWASPYFITNKAKAESELLDPYILIYDRPITELKPFWPLLEKFAKENAENQTQRPLVLFVDKCEGETLATLTVNTSKGNFKACVVELATLGQNKADFLNDIAAFTGGTSINELQGIKLENVEIHHLGQAKKIVVSKSETIIIEGAKDDVIYDNLIESLKDQEKELEDGEIKVQLKRRIARLKGSVATLTVGGITEIAMKEAADRAEDAVRSVGCSIEEGVIPGGGTAFIRCGAVKPEDILEGDAGQGQLLVTEAMTSSLVQICINSGIDPYPILADVMQAKGSMGYNAKTGQIEDLLKAGIIEPVKSNRCALQNAASLISQILLSDYMIVDTI